MTNGQYTDAYSDFLAIYCGCHADSEGNRPCNYGCFCDKCMIEAMQKRWEKFKADWEFFYDEKA